MNASSVYDSLKQLCLFPGVQGCCGEASTAATQDAAGIRCSCFHETQHYWCFCVFWKVGFLNWVRCTLDFWGGWGTGTPIPSSKIVAMSPLVTWGAVVLLGGQINWKSSTSWEILRWGHHILYTFFEWEYTTECLSHNCVNFLSSYPAPIQNGVSSSPVPNHGYPFA